MLVAAAVPTGLLDLELQEAMAAAVLVETMTLELQELLTLAVAVVVEDLSLVLAWEALADLEFLLLGI
jgi:hypothetical protein